MNYSQFPINELAEIFSKALPLIKKRKFFFSIIYLILVLYFSIPSFNIPWLQYNGTRITSLMEQRALKNFMIYYPRQAWADIDNVNPNLLRAIISMEDGKFFKHKGIDWKELKTSIRLNKRRGRTVRGGSTISMQLSKNLFLSTSKSVWRKGKEFLITLRIEKELSKKSILENYINIIEWGDGIFGIEKASDIYFNKDPKNLSATESARLAAVIPSPLRYDPAANSRYVSRRSSIIRGRLSDVQLFPDDVK
ncbi:MAG TPA: monofunctional biosynthetic peptidoglycan transglycosylase [Ignavibacteriales bacterium]|nr:monofunctional biosynthetic peptidoglycan transglycosylase [Ignavibacteriales bacterium]